MVRRGRRPRRSPPLPAGLAERAGETHASSARWTPCETLACACVHAPRRAERRGTPIGDVDEAEDAVKIGLYIRLLGRPGSQPPAPSWSSVREQALAAEASGFDLVVLEDALMYPDEAGSLGVWESVSMAGAVAAATSTIGIGHAVMNSPYRAPALTAKIAATLDEIAGGRYTFGLGLGNTPDDYLLFGIEAEPRYSRFAEAIQIIHGPLRAGRADFEGEFYQARGAELILRGPRSTGPPIVIAAGKPKAMRLVARYADEWNWWTGDRDGIVKLRARRRDGSGLRGSRA